MEKIVNLQMMPGSMPADTQTRQVQGTDAGGGFLQMLQQKQETSDAKPKADEPAKPVTDEKTGGREDAKEEPVKEEDLTADAQQLILELAAQQAAVQNTVTVPEIQEQPAVTEVQAAVIGEIPTELQAEEAEILMPEVSSKTQIPEQTQQAQTPADAAEDRMIPQTAAAETKPQETRQEAFASEGESRSGETDLTPKTVVSASGTAAGTTTEKAAAEQEEEPEVLLNPVNQNPVLQQGTDSYEPVKGPEETVMKSTVEELPQELGKALSSGQTAGAQTLTVELEPVSLGKLTIHVEYEAGRTAVSIMASNPKTLELLSQKASEIASILKEHTGEETVIYTQEPQRQEADQYEGHQGSGRGGQEEQKQQKEEERQQTESFAQQLRLGLV